MCENAGGSTPETSIDNEESPPKPRRAPVGEVEMVVVEFSSLSALGFLCLSRCQEILLNPSSLNMKGHLSPLSPCPLVSHIQLAALRKFTSHKQSLTFPIPCHRPPFSSICFYWHLFWFSLQQQLLISDSFEQAACHFWQGQGTSIVIQDSIFVC